MPKLYANCLLAIAPAIFRKKAKLGTFYGNTNTCISKQRAAIFVILCPFQRAKFIRMMGRKSALSETEKLKIVEWLHSKVSTYLGNSERIWP